MHSCCIRQIVVRFLNIVAVWVGTFHSRWQSKPEGQLDKRGFIEGIFGQLIAKQSQQDADVIGGKMLTDTIEEYSFPDSKRWRYLAAHNSLTQEETVQLASVVPKRSSGDGEHRVRVCLTWGNTHSPFFMEALYSLSSVQSHQRAQVASWLLTRHKKWAQDCAHDPCLP